MQSTELLGLSLVMNAQQHIRDSFKHPQHGCMAVPVSSMTPAYVDEVQRQRTLGQLLVEAIQVGHTGGGVGGTNGDLHDQVAVAEEGRVAGGAVRVRLVNEVKGLAWVRCEVAHLHQAGTCQHGRHASHSVLLVAQLRLGACDALRTDDRGEGSAAAVGAMHWGQVQGLTASQR